MQRGALAKESFILLGWKDWQVDWTGGMAAGSLLCFALFFFSSHRSKMKKKKKKKMMMIMAVGVSV
ncbi:hypothetical protein BO94DRAFT_538738 [Aspergillus sclerotioniger CBS 115572]|uniref:Uncharacterized protein n=1 Tax=Aspergillus sclerotioniger CBS 115572 TaxID=1450535 RepID=A0A317VJR0_9EURO|nr:hypothetical protein BO94DRAFT_538738 [Aspergillus sclerotioniger CBS 115572]PWY74573.1 hypothetical protein BO94DRAFT_538738 [Aspergillus sclerotioniger CBS 115572]